VGTGGENAPAEVSSENGEPARAEREAGRLGAERGEPSDRGSTQSTYNGMDPLEADRQAKLNHYLLPAEENIPELGTDPNALPDPASLITTPGVNPRRRLQ